MDIDLLDKSQGNGACAGNDIIIAPSTLTHIPDHDTTWQEEGSVLKHAPINVHDFHKHWIFWMLHAFQTMLNHEKLPTTKGHYANPNV